MLYTRKAKIHYAPALSQDIAARRSAQRQAKNLAIAHILAHPQTAKNELNALLTQLRQSDPTRYAHASVACQRAGLDRGRNSVIAFHKTQADTLKESIKEVDLRQAIANGNTKTPKPPKRIPNHSRNPDPHRLFVKGSKDQSALCYDDQGYIKLIPNAGKPSQATRIRVDGITLTLTKPVPASLDIRAVQILPRNPVNANNPADQRYDIRLIVKTPDPRPKLIKAVTGFDMGVANTLADSQGLFYNLESDEIEAAENRIKEINHKLPKLKPGSRQYRKLLRERKRLRRRIGGIKQNWECHTAKDIARNHNAVAMERLSPKQMSRSAKGTLENPGRNVRAKSGLNRSIQHARWGCLKARVKRANEKEGAHFVEVPPHNTSITCPNCGHRDRASRKSQAVFACTACRYTAHADTVGAVNVAKRGSRILHDRLIRKRNKRKRHGPAEGKAVVRGIQGPARGTGQADSGLPAATASPRQLLLPL